ncbi:MAG TPA: NAD(P)/FAD-dependent oxidoreductase [Bacteroidales bacterium]|nr:NAD(P)/FAD-dependent oxidoreductase [Bacteroidales bacterium]
MNSNTKENDIIIIGAGFAGLAAGIYAQMNGYKTRIFEMHDKPGGLCTSWKRKGYTFDGCIHWLVGSNPQSGFNRLWQEVGIAQGREFINMDEYMRLEGADGRKLIFYSDIDRLEKHLLEFSPTDEKHIKDFIRGIRICLPFDQPAENVPLFTRLLKKLKIGVNFLVNGKKMQEWMKITAQDFAGRIKDPLLAEAFKEMWIPEFSMFFMLFTFAYLHNKNAGYPIGGSMPMSEALADRYEKLGGKIHYSKRVEKIIVEENKAVGIILKDGTETRSEKIISAADGYSTIFNMLNGKYADEKIREPYEKWLIFQPLIFVGLGVNRTFENEPLSVSGFSIPLRQPVEIGDTVRNRLWVHIYNHDPSLAPEGKSTIIVMLDSVHDYWKKLSEDRDAYRKKKEEIAETVVSLLDQRFPGLASRIEVTDVATPLTFERYTGNWQGSFEGWLITPENSKVLMKPMSQRLPGLENFYMCGQWIEPGGGLPTSIMSGRRLVKTLCKADRKKFRAVTE